MAVGGHDDAGGMYALAIVMEVQPDVMVIASVARCGMRQVEVLLLHS